MEYPIPEIPDDSENKLGTDRVLTNISGLGRVPGTPWALVVRSSLEGQWMLDVISFTASV